MSDGRWQTNWPAFCRQWVLIASAMKPYTTYGYTIEVDPDSKHVYVLFDAP